MKTTNNSTHSVEPTKRLYLDLDGVMADFDAHFPAIFGLDHRGMADDAMWKIINEHPSYFRDMPPCPGAIEFFRSIESLRPIILTACPRTNYQHVARQKRAWVRQHLSEHVTVLPVMGGRNKPLFMQEPGDVLIDDFQRNTEAWDEAGGVSILHRNFEETRTALAVHFLSLAGSIEVTPTSEVDDNIDSMMAAIINCAEAVAFFDQVKASSDPEKIAVGRDDWNWIESACRRVAELSVVTPKLESDTGDDEPFYQFREIGEGQDWQFCSKVVHDSFQRDPHIDTREITASSVSHASMSELPTVCSLTVGETNVADAAEWILRDAWAEMCGNHHSPEYWSAFSEAVNFTIQRLATPVSTLALAGRETEKNKPDHKEYKVLGTTYDGVKILEPKTKSTNFTTEEIREAIKQACKRGL